ncbi:hypothetical protein C5F63_10195 [Photobacterium damselae subsp. damselae]|nr:hypothetical protein C5F63_10195 [Photobacterium damselae subsp. damselae]
MGIVNRALLAIGIICLVLVFKTSDEQAVFQSQLFDWTFGQFAIGNTILFNLASGFLISIWFYFLVVYIPDIQRRKRIKKHFGMQYLEFRKQVIMNILGECDECYSADLPKMLIHPPEFKSYFAKTVKPGQTRWDVFVNNANMIVVQRILSEFVAFKEATFYLLSKIDIEDEELHSFLHNFNTITITMLNTSTDDYDSMKIFYSYLYDIFAGYNFTSGSRDYDYFIKMLEKL